MQRTENCKGPQRCQFACTDVNKGFRKTRSSSSWDAYSVASSGSSVNSPVACRAAQKFKSAAQVSSYSQLRSLVANATQKHWPSRHAGTAVPSCSCISSTEAKHHSVIKSLVQEKALNEPTLAPLYLQLCWTEHKMLLSWQISLGHCESKDQSQPLLSCGEIWFWVISQTQEQPCQLHSVVPSSGPDTSI